MSKSGGSASKMQNYKESDRKSKKSDDSGRMWGYFLLIENFTF